MATVRRGRNHLSKHNGIRPGKQSGNHPYPSWCFAGSDHFCELCRQAFCPLIPETSSKAIARSPLQRHADPFAFRAGKIAGNRLINLIPSKRLFFLYPFFQCRKRIRHCGQTAGIHCNVIILHTAMRRVQSLFDRAVTKQIQRQLRSVQILVCEMKVDPFCHAFHCFGQMTGIYPVQFLRRFRPGLRGILVIGYTEYLGQIDFDQVVERILQAGQGHPVASHGNPPTSQFRRITVSHKSLYQRAIAGKAWTGFPIFQQNFQSSAEQCRIQTVMYTDGQIAGGFQPMRRFQDHKGEIARHIFSRRIGTGDLIIMWIAQQQAGNNVDGLLSVYTAIRQVFFIIRSEQFVQLTACACAAIDPFSHIVPCDPLTNFPKISRRILYQPFIAFQHFLQVFFFYGICLHRDHLPDFIDGPGNQIHDAQKHVFFRGIKLLFFRVNSRILSNLF